MKKDILYIAMACLALGFTACSDDPEDAVEKRLWSRRGSLPACRCQRNNSS